jgi:hypothetical protein
MIPGVCADGGMAASGAGAWLELSPEVVEDELPVLADRAGDLSHGLESLENTCGPVRLKKIQFPPGRVPDQFLVAHL